MTDATRPALPVRAKAATRSGFASNAPPANRL